MRKEKFIFSKFNKDNRGFSIVELIVAVSILAVVFIPVLKNFTMGALTNAKAQKMQNVTSVAEKMMEEVKGDSIEKLYDDAVASEDIMFLSGADATDYLSGGEHSSDSADYDEPPYVIVYDKAIATQGTTYKVCVKIDHASYAIGSAPDASRINTVKLPQLYDVKDSKDHAVLSWEMSEYDFNAFNNLADENTREESTNSSIKNIIKDNGIKTTTITLDDASGGTVDISCNVTYTTGNSSYSKALEYDVYSGNLKNLDVDEENNGGPHIYLFYKMAAIDNSEYMPHEVISVVDNTTAGVHNVYLMLQNNGYINDLRYTNETKSADLELTYNGNTLAKGDGSGLSATHWNSPEGAAHKWDYYTNLTSNYGIESGNLYDVKRKNRVYEVTVTVYDGDEYMTEVVSSMGSGEEAKSYIN
ncbi:MAG: type II secretion system protein [Lachnospiraceae bacterium]|nr:type II secretion system protein [Lachnospiraceae bacterium]